jgi:8-oxo-dGTP pyrophosphatase MutT (NUDIX family)
LKFKKAKIGLAYNERLCPAVPEFAMSRRAAPEEIFSPAISRDWIAQRLAAPGTVRAPAGDVGHAQPFPHKDGSARAGITSAGVLVALVNRAQGPHVVFTQRTDHLSDHAGQISFPGGRAEEHDADIIHTALRESEEEIGLAPERVEVLGTLPDYFTITGYRVTPVVGWIDADVSFTPDPFEVAEVFEVPLAFFLDAANHQRHSLMRDGQERFFYAMPYNGRYIWGATAGMLVTLQQVLMRE